ncbi:MAG: hypothetical protein WA667_06685 [Candidatus Nitrosopolaris sp.]
MNEARLKGMASSITLVYVLDTCHKSILIDPPGRHAAYYKQGGSNGRYDANSGSENDGGTYGAKGCKN